MSGTVTESALEAMTAARLSALQEIVEWRKTLWQPIPDEPVAAWCERNLVLSSRETATPGPFTLYGREYVREILECFRDPTVDDVTASMGSQLGKSLSMVAGLGWMVTTDPGPSLLMTANADLAKSFAKTRLLPFFAENEVIRQEMLPGKDAVTHLEVLFRKCNLRLVGSGSVASAISRPVRYLIADEVSSWKPPGKSQLSVLEMVQQRTKSFANAKVFVISTPAAPNGELWMRYLKGDRRRYHVPCIHCGEQIVFEWRHVKWDAEAKLADGTWDFPRVAASAHYACQRCQGKITDADKVLMVRRGEWRPTSQSAVPGVRSYQLSSLYSPDRKCGWGALAVRWLQAQDSALALASFVTGNLAEPFGESAYGVERVELFTDEQAQPLEGSIRILTSDVQATQPHFYWVCRDWDVRGHSRLVSAGTTETWEGLHRVQLALGVDNHRVGVDAAFNSSEVYTAALARSKLVPRHGNVPLAVGWCCIRGRAAQSLYYVDRNGKRPSLLRFARAALPPGQQVELPVIEFHADEVTTILQRLRRPDNTANVRWELVPLPTAHEIEGARIATEEAYFRHLDALVRKPHASGRTGRITMLWTPRTNHWPDHWLDAERLQIVMAMVHKRLGTGVVVEPQAAPEPASA